MEVRRAISAGVKTGWGIGGGIMEVGAFVEADLVGLNVRVRLGTCTREKVDTIQLWSPSV